MKAIFENIAAVAGATTLAILTLAITHEFGYFFFIGSNFQAFLTTSDYFSNAILWLPVMFIMFGWGDWSLLREDREPETIVLKNWRTWIWPALGVLWFALMTAVTPWPPRPGYMAFSLVIFILIWSKIWRALIILLPRANTEAQKIGRPAIRLGIPTLVAVFVLGWYNASQDLTRQSDPYIFELKGEKKRILGVLLRSFDKGVLFKNASSDRIELRRWDDIIAIEKPVGRSRPFVCWTFGWCFGIDTTPAP